MRTAMEKKKKKKRGAGISIPERNHPLGAENEMISYPVFLKQPLQRRTSGTPIGPNDQRIIISRWSWREEPKEQLRSQLSIHVRKTRKKSQIPFGSRPRPH